jgi:hypothetical protein
MVDFFIGSTLPGETNFEQFEQLVVKIVEYKHTEEKR